MFEIKGVEVKQEGELISLTDIWKASGKSKNYGPYFWTAKEGRSFIKAVAKELKVDPAHTLKTVKGRYGGTFSNWQIALAYAKYLSPELHMEVNRTFMRAKSGDIDLADEIVEKASPEDQIKHAIRMEGKFTRLEFTSTLKAHGVTYQGYPQCTNSIYYGLFNKTAKSFQEERGLQKHQTRDGMTAEELTAVRLAEMTAQRKIKEEKLHGNTACSMKCGEVATKIKQAIQ